MPSATAQGDPAGALSSLIRAVLDQPGMSTRRLSAESVDPETGQRPGATWLGDLARGEISRAPEPHVLRALAAGTGYSLFEVQAAAASQFLGFVPTEMSDLPDDVRAMVVLMSNADPSELPRARAVLEALISHRSEKSRSNDV